MSLSPKALRLNLHSRLLLLCVGAALPILTVFALSLMEQFHLLQAARQQSVKATAFALANSLENWGIKHFGDLPQIYSQSISNSNQNSANEFFAQIAKRFHYAEIFRIFPDRKLIAYYPTRTDLVKPPFNASNLYDFSNTKKSRVSFFDRSPLTGQNKLLIIDNADKVKALPNKIKTLPKITKKIAYKHKKHRTKHAAKHAAQHASRPSTLKTFNADLSKSKLVIAIDPKVLLKVLSQSEQNMPDDISDELAASTLAIADSAKNVFGYVYESKNTSKSQIEEFVPSLGVYIFISSGVSQLNSPLYAWLLRTVLLALIAILASSYLVFIASKHFTRQIKLLVKEVLTIGRGDFSRRLEIQGNDELGKLAKAINKIASKMQLDQDHRRMEEKISQAIRQSLDLDQVLMATVTELGRALEASRCCLALVDIPRSKGNTDKEQSRELIFDYIWCDENKNGTPLNNRSLTIEAHGVMSMIIEQGSILSLDVLDEDGPSPLFENGKIAPQDWRTIRSLIACPITSAEGTIGLILIQQCDKLRSWTDKEIELVEVVTRQLTLAMQHAHLFYYTRTMAEQEMLINHIVRCVRGSLDLDTILNTVSRELCSAIGADRCQILQPSAKGPLVVSHEYHIDPLKPTIGIDLYAQELNFSPAETEAVFARGNFLLGIDLEKLSLRSNDISAENVIKHQSYDPWSVAVIGNTENDARAAAFKYFLLSSASKSLIAAPLLNKNRLIGLLVVHQCDHPRTWRSGEIQLVAAIADQLALAVTQASLFAQVKHQAITDGLTGLYNHVYFQNRLSEEIRLADRKGLPCSLLMMDLDLLKQINDKYGHPVGDAAIRQVAITLKTLLRSGDTAARYGGEEFAIILPETSLLEAALIGDRLCTHIANAKVPGLGQITISIGAASYPRQAKDAMELINRADQALYEAKKSGRNQIWISESVSDKALRADEIVPEFRVTRRLALANNRKPEETQNVH